MVFRQTLRLLLRSEGDKVPAVQTEGPSWTDDSEGWMANGGVGLVVPFLALLQEAGQRRLSSLGNRCRGGREGEDKIGSVGNGGIHGGGVMGLGHVPPCMAWAAAAVAGGGGGAAVEPARSSAALEPLPD